MWALISIAAVAALSFLGWNLYQRFGADRIAKLNEQRKDSSRLVSRGEFVEGSRRIEVALAVTSTTFFYENADLKAYLDLQWIREIEYDTELATGRTVEGRVLRMRAYSQTFEFVIPRDRVSEWHMTLPPRRLLKPALSGIDVDPALLVASNS